MTCHKSVVARIDAASVYWLVHEDCNAPITLWINLFDTSPQPRVSDYVSKNPSVAVPRQRARRICFVHVFQAVHHELHQVMKCALWRIVKDIGDGMIGIELENFAACKTLPLQKVPWSPQLHQGLVSGAHEHLALVVSIRRPSRTVRWPELDRPMCWLSMLGNQSRHNRAHGKTALSSSLKSVTLPHMIEGTTQ